MKGQTVVQFAPFPCLAGNIYGFVIFFKSIHSLNVKKFLYVYDPVIIYYNSVIKN